MTFWSAFKQTYGGGTAFLIACPLLALVPIAFEFLQHVVEVRIGMYDSLAGAKTVEHHPARMGFGMVKVAALTAAGVAVIERVPHHLPPNPHNAHYLATKRDRTGHQF